MKYIGVLRDTARAPKPTTQYNTIQYHAIPFIRYKNCWFTHLCRKNKNSADLRTFVVKMSRVEFTRFFKTIIFILLVFLLVFYSYFCLKSARISLVFSKKWARMKNWTHCKRHRVAQSCPNGPGFPKWSRPQGYPNSPKYPEWRQNGSEWCD